MSPVEEQRQNLLLDPRWLSAAEPTFKEIRATMGRVPNIHRMLAAAPELLRSWYRFSQDVRLRSESSRASRELAILRVAQLESADYVWLNHQSAAISAGVDPILLGDLAGWRQNGVASVSDAAVLRFVDECIGEGTVSSQTWDSLVAAFSLPGALEITVTTCWYLCVTRVARVLQVPLENAQAGGRPSP